jgi:hypothetical protein
MMNYFVHVETARPSYWEKKLRRTTLPPTDEEGKSSKPFSYHS